MEHQDTGSEITFHHDVPGPENVKRIWRTFWLLLVITIIELAMGFSIYIMHKDPNFSHGLVLGIKGAIVILSLAKAFYIVSIFMHLGDEIRNMAMSIVVPLMLFIWFIAAFLYEGNSYKNLRNTFDKHFEERTIIDKKAGGH
jgi:hypothetical protein